MGKIQLIYHPQLAPRFGAYGIPVPLGPDRSTHVWQQLKKAFPHLTEIDLNHLPSLSWQDVALAHDLDFIARLLEPTLSRREVEHCFEMHHYHRREGTWEPLESMPEDVLQQCRGTLHACELALDHGSSFFLGGGMHHAMRFAGRGFCLLNDIVISARKLQRDRGLGKILVIDVDAHKGDGTAEITQRDSSIQTLSVHMAQGWPLDGSLGAGPWLLASDIDVAIEVSQEDSYLPRLKEALCQLDLSHASLAIVVLGADAWEGDELPSSQGIKLTLTQMLERDQLIFNTLKKANIPAAFVMGGGYGTRAHEPYVQFLSSLLQ